MARKCDSYGITSLRMDDILHLKGVIVGEVIGIGAFGKVLHVEHGENTYAAKRMDESLLVEKFTMRSMKDFCRKCSPIFNLSQSAGNRRKPHQAGTSVPEGAENIVKYIGIYQEDVHAMPLLVMELMHVELRYMLHTHKETMTFRDRVNICLDIARGLNFLHSSIPEILHRNLHSNNILLDSKMRAKISDVMNMRLMTPEHMLKKEITSVPGHEEYLPPEVFQDVRLYNAGSDIFSFGVLVMEIVTHSPPRPLRNVKIFETQRRNSDLSLVPGNSGLVSIIHKCIRDHNSERPSAEQMCSELMMLKKSLQYGMSPGSQGKQASFSELLLTQNCQIRWEKCSIIPVGVSSATAVMDDNRIIYIGGGWAGDATNLTSITTYNPQIDYWSALPSCPVQYGRLAMVGKEGLKLVTIGGIQADWRITDQVFTWEGAGKWKESYPHMSIPRLSPAVGVYNKRYIIVAGGMSRNCSLDNIEVLDTETEQWSLSVVKLPYSMTEAVGSIAGDNFIIMGNCSEDEGEPANTRQRILSIPIFAILGESAITITTLPPPPHPHSSLIPNIDPPVLLGGCAKLPGVFVYNSEPNNWKQVGQTSCSRSHATGIAIHSNAILLLGGVTEPDSVSKETAVRDVETGYLDDL